MPSCLHEEKVNMSSYMMFKVTVKLDSQPLYDEEYLTIEEQISIKLEMILINKLLVGFKAAKERIVDFDAELKFIEDWLEKPKNVDYVCDAECIRFADAEEILLQISTTLHIADCNRAWRTIISEKFTKFAEAQGRFRTADAQSNSIMNIEDFKFSSKKRKKKNKYCLTARKVKMKWRIVEFEVLGNIDD